MTISPVPAHGSANPGALRSARLVGSPPVRPAPTPRRIAQRRWVVGITKHLLPVIALALLSSVALWPEIIKETDRARISYPRGMVEPESGEVIDARYHGIDERNRPYTMTATSARQVGPERFDLVNPKGDVTLQSGNWLMVQSKAGVYIQHAGQLDLSGDVTLYRDDGTTMQTSAAAVDLKAGAAAGADMVHAEGPFGTLDAQGFALTDSGAVIQFTGPGRLVINERSK